MLSKVISPIVLAIEDGVTTDVTGLPLSRTAELTFTGNPTWLLRVLMLQLLINGLSATSYS